MSVPAPMPSLSSRAITLALASFAALAAGAAAVHPTLDAAGSARLDALQRAPDAAGARVYRGAVFAPQAPATEPLFTYERRVGTTPDGLSSSHITRDPAGAVIIAEEAQFTPAYALQRFDAANRQLGFSGSVVLSNGGRRLDYRLNQNGKLSTATETVNAPVVAGPTLHGFVLQHWDALANGKAVPVRMIALAQKTSYGFDIRRLPDSDGLSSFSITPSSLFVRLAIAPLKVSFDSNTRALVRYEGRVPPMLADGGKLRNLDARVDYTMDVTRYR